MIKATPSRSNARQQQPHPIRRVLSLFTLFGLVASTGCHSYGPKQYRGSGRMVAVKAGNFLLNCTTYTVLLGPVDLNRRGKVVFRLQGLPHEAMNLGFNTSLSNLPANVETRKSDALVRIELANDGGATLIRIEERLDRLTWSRQAWEEHKSFVYWLGDGDKSFMELRSDEGSGSYFKPRTNGKYTLTIEVLEPDSKGIDYHAELEIHNFCD